MAEKGERTKEQARIEADTSCKVPKFNGTGRIFAGPIPAQTR